MFLWTICRIIFSNRFPVVDKRLIALKVLGNLRSLSDFGNVMTFAFKTLAIGAAEGSD
jgi:hypothetical protein